MEWNAVLIDIFVWELHSHRHLCISRNGVPTFRVCIPTAILKSSQWRNEGFQRPGAEAMKCATPQKFPRESDANMQSVLVRYASYTTVVVPSRQLPCNSVIFTARRFASNSVCLSLRPFVRPSHAGIVSICQNDDT